MTSYLPRLVKHRYGTDLRARTLTSIKPEISQALESLLEELRTAEDAKAMRMFVSKVSRPKLHPPSYRSSPKSCPLCKTAERPDRHFLSKCSFLPSQIKLFMAKVRSTSGIYDDDDGECIDCIEPEEPVPSVASKPYPGQAISIPRHLSRSNICPPYNRLWCHRQYDKSLFCNYIRCQNFW